MYSYKKEIDSIQQMLNSFLETKLINTQHLSKMDAIIKRSDLDQIKTLNSVSSLSTQRVIFGAIRNINTSLKGMKEKLRTAALRHENPTTAEQAIELMDSLSNVALCIDVFNTGEIHADEIDNIAKLSRILYKKAKAFGFSEDTHTQLKEACVNEAIVKIFVNSFDDNLTAELDLQEEVKSTGKNNN
jgi:hypothetical protein